MSHPYSCVVAKAVFAQFDQFGLEVIDDRRPIGAITVYKDIVADCQAVNAASFKPQSMQQLQHDIDRSALLPVKSVVFNKAVAALQQ